MSKKKHVEEGNFGFVCPDHKPKPNAAFAELPVEFYYGKFVKLGFPAVNPITGVSGTEHMWVKVLGPALAPPEELLGELHNSPVMVTDYEHGDRVAFSRSEIEMVDGPKE